MEEEEDQSPDQSVIAMRSLTFLYIAHFPCAIFLAIYPNGKSRPDPGSRLERRDQISPLNMTVGYWRVNYEPRQQRGRVAAKAGARCGD